MRNVYSIGAGFLPTSFKPAAGAAPVVEEAKDLDLILESVELVEEDYKEDPDLVEGNIAEVEDEIERHYESREDYEDEEQWEEELSELETTLKMLEERLEEALQEESADAEIKGLELISEDARPRRRRRRSK